MKSKNPKNQHPLGFPLPPRRTEGAKPSAKPVVRPRLKLDDRDDDERGPSPKGRRLGRMRPATMSLAPRPVAPGNRPAPNRSAPPERAEVHVASLEVLARSTLEVAEVVEHAVFVDKRRADIAISHALRDRRELGPTDQRFVHQAVMALFRWHGWVETLHLDRLAERMILSLLLDAPSVHPVCRLWAKKLDLDADALFALGGAPNWTARGEGWKRLHSGSPVNADPWRLVPQWLRDHLPLPKGGGTAKMKWLELLNSLQARPALWLRAQGKEPKAVWASLQELGLKPWIHRELLFAAKIDRDADVHHLPPFKKGELEIQDLSSQLVSLVCDPDPGERWWDVCSGAGGKALHLAALMEGKGLVVAGDVNERKLQEAVRRARRSPFRNITTKVWDGKHVVGKAGKFDGVLVDAPCSAIGTWRRNPDARWLLDKDAIPRLAETQSKILDVAAQGVRPGGRLVYSVCTLTPSETQQVVQKFLAAHAEFRLDPFKHPLTGEPTDGTLQVWPQDGDSDAMFIARMARVGGKPA